MTPPCHEISRKEISPFNVRPEPTGNAAGKSADRGPGRLSRAFTRKRIKHFFQTFPLLTLIVCMYTKNIRNFFACTKAGGKSGRAAAPEKGREIGRRKDCAKKTKKVPKGGQNKLTNGTGYYIIVPFTCGRGGTGRRARLRILWLTPCRFNSCRPHHLYGMLYKTWQYPVYFLLFWIIILRFSRFLPRLACVLAC